MTAERSEPIPNFFIVGAPKCATTAMDRYLGEHPAIYMSPAKESNFFARDLYPNGGGCTPERYAGFFKDLGDEPVVGESSVFYMLSHTAAEAIHAHNPKAKILIMLRDPVDVVASHHSQIVYETFETEKSLERALALEPERRKKAEGRAIEIPERVRFYRGVVKFADQIERFLNVFPRDQVHIVLYDDVRRDVGEVYRQILRFLGVDEDFEPSFVVENANKEMRSKSFAKFLRRTPNWVSLASRIVLPRRSWRIKLRHLLKRANTNFKPREPIPPALRTSLAAELRPEVEKLSTLLGRDLSHWCAAAEKSDSRLLGGVGLARLLDFPLRCWRDLDCVDIFGSRNLAVGGIFYNEIVEQLERALDAPAGICPHIDKDRPFSLFVQFVAEFDTVAQPVSRVEVGVIGFFHWRAVDPLEMACVAVIIKTEPGGAVGPQVDLEKELGLRVFDQRQTTVDFANHAPLGNFFGFRPAQPVPACGRSIIDQFVIAAGGGEIDRFFENRLPMGRAVPGGQRIIAGQVKITRDAGMIDRIFSKRLAGSGRRKTREAHRANHKKQTGLIPGFSSYSKSSICRRIIAIFCSLSHGHRHNT